MNINLTYEIARHIFASLCVVKSDFVKQDEAKSIIDPAYLLKEKVTFHIDDKTVSNNVYGCQTKIVDKDLRMLLADCTIEKEAPEYCLLIELQDSPPYGVYFAEHAKEDVLIATNMSKKFWMPCTIDLQATFLASMECIKDVTYIWSKCVKYTDQYKQLQAFISYHEEYYTEEANEGQEI